jgi:AraC-like DNA-binding protein
MLISNTATINIEVDANYRLGFTNLSHFSRVFKEHIGMKPKQYSRF